MHVPILAVDSDGCAMDAMEVKHRTCFGPAIIEVWRLEPVASLVMEASLKINLYSRHRGINRYLALSMLFNWLRGRPELEGRCQPPPVEALDAWIASAAALGEPCLVEAIAQSSGAQRQELETVLQWTREVNRRVAQLPPAAAFPEAGPTLRQACRLGLAVHVVSSATRAAIEREWQEAGLSPCVRQFFGQEDCSKTQALRQIAAQAGPGRVLMVGDAPGDRDAASEAGTLFFPIIPKEENPSWTALREQVLEGFLAGDPPVALMRDWESRFLESLPGFP